MSLSGRVEPPTLRSGRLRPQNAPKKPLVECEQCYQQHNNHHPCLFCKGCLRTIREKPKKPGVNGRNGHHSNDVNNSVFDKDIVNGQSLDGSKPAQSTEFWETFMELKTNQKQKNRIEADEKVTQQRMIIMKQKAKKLEKRATRCGFCPPAGRRSQLVSFCVHCRKHLCRTCLSAHRSDPLCKHHGTVDLSTDKNAALL